MISNRSEIFSTCRQLRRITFAAVVAATVLVSQLPMSAQTAPSNSSPPASPQDMLIVELKNGADRQKFDDLLEEVHGTYLRTIDAGPNLKFLVIQAESGKAADLQNKLSQDKDVALVQRNRTYRINEPYISEPLGKGADLLKDHLADHQARHNFFDDFFNHHGKTLPGKGLPGSGLPGNGHGHGGGLPSLPGHPILPGHPHYPPPGNGGGGGGGGGGTPTGVPADPNYSAEYDWPMMHVNDARISGDAPTGNVANLIIVDTGYQPNSDSPVVIHQYDFSNPQNPTGNAEAVHDSGSHGTEVGTVAAWTDNSLAYAGVANLEGQRCALTICRISQDGQSSDSLRIITALAFIASHPLPKGPVNLSFGAAPPNSVNSDGAVQQIAQQLAQLGFKLVLASGNDSTAGNPVSDNSPELYARRVASCDGGGNISSFSDIGPFRGCAPGDHVPVYTAANGTTPYLGSGTSFSAPRWSAAIAVLMSAANISAAQADAIIEQTGTQVSGGFIIPNFKAALDRATGH